VSFKGLWKRLTSTTLGKFVTWTVVTLTGGILTPTRSRPREDRRRDLELDSLADLERHLRGAGRVQQNSIGPPSGASYDDALDRE